MAIALRTLCLTWVALLVFTRVGTSKTWNVYSDGSGDAPTVQAGIDSAATGDTVVVHPGTYEENLNFLGKNILLRSATGPNETVIDGGLRQASCVSFVNHEGPNAHLEGFTIVNGTGNSNGIFGGGIIILGASPTVRRNVISGNATANSGSGGGGGIWCAGTSLDSIWSPRIEENTISGNSTRTLGGGIGVSGNMAPLILNNVISNNQVIEGDGGGICFFSRISGAAASGNKIFGNESGDHGGGIYFGASGGQLPLGIEIYFNLIAENTAKGQGGTGNSGGGAWLGGTNAWVHHNTIANNTGDGPNSAYGGGIVIEQPGSPLIERNIIAFSVKGGGIWCGNGVTPTIRDNLAWQNSGGDGVKDCPAWWQSNGNVVANPYFCDMANGDFRVASNSSVLTHPSGPLGVYPNPGCAPGVPVQPSTWGMLKSRYR